MEAVSFAQYRSTVIYDLQHITAVRVGNQSWTGVGLFSEHKCRSGSTHLVDSANDWKPELSVQTVRMPVEVYSGIAPPQALLDQMADRPSGRPSTNHNLRPHGSANAPSAGPSPGPSRPNTQAQSDHIEPSPSDIPDEAPPSYEDAMADDLAPIDGPRRNYHQQTSSTPPGSSGKGSGKDDRLFPESGRS